MKKPIYPPMKKIIKSLSLQELYEFKDIVRQNKNHTNEERLVLIKYINKIITKKIGE
jgi:uncharacterized protein (DUF885 family)